MSDQYVTYPSPTPRRSWVPWVIIASAVLLVLALVASVAFFSSALSARSAGPQQQLVDGEASEAVAVDPLECATPCFTEADILKTQPDPELLIQLGLDVTSFPAGTYDPDTAGSIHRGSIPGWQNMKASPDACFFAPGNSPVSFVDSDESSDPIHFIGTQTNDAQSSTLDQSVRLFADSASATAYMTYTAGQVEQCDVWFAGQGSDSYSAMVSPSPALSIPDSVASVGWVRTGDPGLRWRAYVIDLQLGNLVVRTRLLTDGSIPELEYRALVESIARQLGELEPTLPE